MGASVGTRQVPGARPIRRAPSLMCMDLMRIADGIAALDDFADEYHVDIIDWHYCKNMSLAPCFIEGVRGLTTRPIEAHLYVDNIDDELVRLCIASGSTVVTMPPEVIERRAFRFAALLKEASVGFGVFLNPATPLAVVEPYADALDRLLVMTVDPGFAGQELVPSTLDKIRAAAELRAARGLSFDIEVDGCCNERFYARLREAGADTFVLGGSGLFGKDADVRRAAAVAERELAAAGCLATGVA